VSLSSLFASVFPIRTGVIDQNADIKKDFKCPIITEILKENGYRTAVFLPSRSAISLTEWTNRGADLRFIYPHSHGRSDYSVLTQKVISWIKKDPKQSFFVWIHYRGVHTPYTPPPPYNRLFVNDEFYDSSKKIPFVDNSGGWGGIMPKVNLNNIQEKDYYIAQYDGALKYVDYWVGELLRLLKRFGVYENAIVIISADHGEAFGEHNLYFEHANTLYDELLRVPLIIKFPKREFQGKRLTMQVRLVDIVPTITQYLGLKAPQYTDGKNLLPTIEGKKDYKPIFSFSETNTMNAVRSEEWKFIMRDSMPAYEELYNLKQDPGELHNLYTKEMSLVRSFRDELKKYRNGFSCACFTPETGNSNIKKAQEALHSLGYAQ